MTTDPKVQIDPNATPESTTTPEPPAAREPPAAHELEVEIEVPAPVCELAEQLEDAGYDTWTVGGAVRDSVLKGPERHDWDLATRASPAQMRRVFKRTVPLGPEHGTLGVFGPDGDMYEITTFRRDVDTDGRRAVVAFADTVEEDLARRDFTVNAMAWHPFRRELRDPHGGLDDLKARILRAVGSPADRFREDYLRVLRGLRFAGTMGLEVEQGTWDGLVDAVSGLDRLSQERVREELLKVMGSRAPSRTLCHYECSGVLSAILPELGGLDAAALEAVDATKARPAGEVALRRVATLLLLGLEAAGTNGDAARAAASDILRRLRFSNAHRERLATVVGCGSAPSRDIVDGTVDGAAARRRWLAATGAARAGEVFRVWIAVHRAGAGAGTRAGAGTEASAEAETSAEAQASAPTTEQLLEVVRASRRDLHDGVPTSLAGLKIGGHDLIALGWSPGPAVGNVLHRLLGAVWEDPSRNQRNTLLELAESWRDANPS